MEFPREWPRELFIRARPRTVGLAQLLRPSWAPETADFRIRGLVFPFVDGTAATNLEPGPTYFRTRNVRDRKNALVTRGTTAITGDDLVKQRRWPLRE